MKERSLREKFHSFFFQILLTLLLRVWPTRWVTIPICLKNSNSKRYHHQHGFERIFNKLFNDAQFDRLCTCGSPVIDVSSLRKFCNLRNCNIKTFPFFPGMEGLKQHLNEKFHAYMNTVMAIFAQFRTLFSNVQKLAGENLPTHCTPVLASPIS